MNSTDVLFDALERCAATSSKKEKQAIVNELGEFKDWLRLALEPSISYYISADQFPEINSPAGEFTLQPAHRFVLEDLADRTISGNQAIETITSTMADLTDKSREVLKRIILKDLRCGVGTTIVNTAFPGLITDPPYMRCVLPKDSNMDAWDWTVGIIVQLKADGQYADVDLTADRQLSISTRQGNRYPAGSLGKVEEIMRAALPADTRTMGELTVYKDSELLPRQDGNGILNSIAQGGELPAGHEVRFDAWDHIPLGRAVSKGRYEEPYRDRLKRLNALLFPFRETLLRVIESHVVYSKAEAYKVYKHYLAQKLEGVICKHPAAIWKDGDNKDQVKLKLEVTVDLIIKGYRPGKPGKRTEKTFGAVIAQTADGLLEVGVSGFKRDVEQYIHEHREELLETVMAVKANGVMEPSGEDRIFSLFSPRFGELRLDKVKGDTLDEVKAQFEAAIA